MSFGVPLSQRMQTQLKWSFSNKKTADIESMVMYMGASAGPMMDQDEASFVQAQSFSSGRLGLHGQTTIPFVKGAKATM